MAKIDVSITYPDERNAITMDALRARYGQVLDAGVYRDRTNQECKAEFAIEVRDLLKSIYQKHKRALKKLEGDQDDLRATV